jgi:site-specific DNA-methyltransferase (adenine-specific)
MPKPITRNTLFYGDNLEILREYIPDESVDLIYLDPPFNSNRSYSVLFKDEKGMDSEAQINAFDDTWHWNERVYRNLVASGPLKVASMLEALHGFIGENQMMAYLVMMAARLVELHRVLKPTGSLYLHCDQTASHYLKIVLDTIFGGNNFRNDIVWERYSRPKGSQFESRKYGVATDNLLFYSKTEDYVFYRDRVRVSLSKEEISNRFNLVDDRGGYYSGPLLRSPSMGSRPNLVFEYRGFTPGPEGWRMTKDKISEIDQNGDFFFTSNGIPRRKIRPTELPAHTITNLWTDIQAIGSQATERLGYPTQKPLALLERIILASSNPGDIVLDPFSGCGTAIAAAQKMDRRWIGIDITHLAIAMHKSRLNGMYKLLPGKDYDVVGEPVDLNGAEALFKQNAYQFQWWAISLIGAKPQGGSEGSKVGKHGSDRGIDGVILFTSDLKGQSGKIIVQVKGGSVSSGAVRDLAGVLDAEKSAMGILLTLKKVSPEMKLAADKAGVYHSDLWNQDYPRIQVVTVEDLLDGKKPDLPRWLDDPHKKAERVKDDGKGQMGLEM